MKTQEAWPGARLVDSYPFSVGGTNAQAQALARTAVDALAGYVGVITRQRIDFLHAAGVAFLAVTRAGAYTNGAADEIAWLKAVGYPKGADVFLDLEGLSAYHADPAALMGLLNAWGRPVLAEGWTPKLYVGAPQPLTSSELYSLVFRGYWQGIGKPVDRHEGLVYPDCGWQIVQQWHGEPTGMMWKDTGVLVDTNGIGRDHKRRLPVWAVGG